MTLLHFANPGIFKLIPRFDTYLLSQPAKFGEFKEKLVLFLLRREKEGVLDLPPRRDLVLEIPMTSLQKEVYLACLKKNVRTIGRSVTNSTSSLWRND